MSRKTVEEELAELDRNEKCIFYALGILQRLKEKGLVTVGILQISEKGELCFEILEDQGFKPSQQELEEAMAAIQHICRN